ncbi:endoglucanase 8-like [Andrographis paniculata]|uniref:endoglucanase 8-like n=1 Tax=Andrographis paniculata TaxID=175694 RepID=UPI0021E8F38E|nr:endoglucanase 8-like [Andrographis paniculata]
MAAADRRTFILVLILLCILPALTPVAKSKPVHNYADALSKSIMFFEGQRSGKLPLTQRLRWRKDSALSDGSDNAVDLTGGYYDAGDNVKFNFPMAFTATMLAWSVQQYGRFMGNDLPHAVEAIRWATDYFLKSTATHGVVYAQVGEPYGDHACWQRPEDMTTPRTSYQVNTTAPGSEVAAEMAAAMAAASLVFRSIGDRNYSRLLLGRAVQVFEFADKYRGSYNNSIGNAACPFYCDFSGYQDELIWAAAWLHRATRQTLYWNYIVENLRNPEFKWRMEGNNDEFNWDAKNAGINILLSKVRFFVLANGLESSTPFINYADNFVCNILPESPTRYQHFSSGGLIVNSKICNMQSVTSRSFLLVTYATALKRWNRTIQCDGTIITPSRIVRFAKTQVDYILGDNPMNMSYMVGYSEKYPQKIHHRGATLPSIDVYPQFITCHGGAPYFLSPNPDQNLLIGAVVGGPGEDDQFDSNRFDAGKTEPTTYVNAPLVGALAFFKALHRQ